MSLAAGARLGPYEIVSPLGAGGMGEVYRATDARLNRTVAIKVLSDESASDTDRRQRFEREAKVISTLEHPNICPLYDVGDHQGTYFLVMPCFEGQTLAERLTKGPLSSDQAIKYAAEIATGLDAAHRRGIIHRDLKPGNIMLTKTGVKLLDFGLAKLKKDPGPVGHTTLATGTGIGTLLGTMPYMAPEQIEGRDVDARSDIFSLGAVIYEMVTGHRAFKGETPGSVIGSILKDDPPPMKTLQPLTPSALDHVVTTCLHKDPEDRWQSAVDVAHELKWIARDRGDTMPARRVGTSRAFWSGAAMAAVIAAALAMAWPSRTVTVPAEAIQFALAPPEAQTFMVSRSSIGIMQFAVSPNGKSIVFVAAGADSRPRLWVRLLGDVTAKALSGSDGASDPFWAPDSTQVGFFANGRLKSVDTATGTVRDICAASNSSRGGAWAPDGTIVFGADSLSGLSRVSTTTGNVEPITLATDNATSHRWPAFLPDGRRFLYIARGEEADRGVYVASLDGGQPKRILGSLLNATYANGFLLTVNAGTLLAYPFDLQSLTVTGESTIIAQHLGASSTQHAAFSTSATGVLVYAAGANVVTTLDWYDRLGRPLGAAQKGHIVNFRLSPDGSQLAFSRVDPETSTSDIWLMDVTRSTSSRLTLHPMVDLGPVWSSDASQIVFRSDRSGGNHLYQKQSAGTSAEQLLIKKEVANPTDWSPDGRYVAYHNTVPKAGLDLGVVEVATGQVTWLAHTMFDEYDGRFSPDGRWLAYVSEESGTPQIYVQPFPATGDRITVSVNGGGEPRWRRDGRELFYVSRDRRLMSVAVDLSRGLRVGATRELFQTAIPTAPNPYRTHLEPTPDGQRFLISSATQERMPANLTVVVNWPSAINTRN